MFCSTVKTEREWNKITLQIYTGLIRNKYSDGRKSIKKNIMPLSKVNKINNSWD